MRQAKAKITLVRKRKPAFAAAPDLIDVP